jgi:diguanylate cyclase (GGDEF)-like protein/PAS domain S-box-containing protein
VENSVEENEHKGRKTASKGRAPFTWATRAVYGAATAARLLGKPAGGGTSGGIKQPRQSQANLAKLLRYATNVFSVVDQFGVILYQSPSLERVLGYSVDELLGRPLAELVHPDDRGRVETFGSDAIPAGESRRIYCRFRHADGTYRYVDNVCTNLLADPEVSGIVVNTRDATEERLSQKALQDSEEKFRNVAESAHDAIVSVDRDGAILFWNQGAENVFGYQQEEVIGKPLTLLMPECHRKAQVAALKQRMSAGPFRSLGEHIEFEGRRKNGEEFPLELSVAEWNMGEQTYYSGIMRDISERRKAENLLREREEFLRFLIERVPVVVYRAEVGSEGRWLYVSPQIETLLGYTPEEWQSDPTLWLQRIHPDDRQACLTEEEAVRLTVDEKPEASEYRMMARDGRVIWVIDDAFVVRDSNGAPHYWSGVLYDITERKNLEQQLEHQALSDSLTGLANRALFLDRVEHALARGGRDEEPVTILFLDLDDFKTVNDSLGHEAGDELLVTVASRLKRCLRPADTVARLGGDEFAILLESTSAESAVALARRVLEALGEPYSAGGRAMVVRASIGVATGSAPAHDAGDLLRNADVAMYVAKGGGKARMAVFEPGMHTAALRRLEMKADLQRAVTEGELVLHYQPIVNLGDGALVGVEALVRWQHPELGLVPPGDFIPLAEESGLIIPLGRWVLSEACRQSAEWQRQIPVARGVAVSVNVSARQLLRPELIGEVEDALVASGIAPAALTLEITESGLMEEKDVAAAQLEDLRRLGVRVAVDDFGTGYSSLGYLSSLPIDILKIDKMFIDGVSQGPEDSAIAGAVGKLATALGLTLVAEGIESLDQVVALRGMEFERGQGHFFSRALPPAEVAVLLRNAVSS